MSDSNAFGITAGGAVRTSAPAISGSAAPGNTLSVRRGRGRQRPSSATSGCARVRRSPSDGVELRRLRPDAGKELTVIVFAAAQGFDGGLGDRRSGGRHPPGLDRRRWRLSLRTGDAQDAGQDRHHRDRPDLQRPTGQVKVFDGAKTLKTLTLVSVRNGQLR